MKAETKQTPQEGIGKVMTETELNMSGKNLRSQYYEWKLHLGPLAQR